MMADNDSRSISELLDDDVMIAQALTNGVREALLGHARAGNPVPVCEDGQITWLSPEEIYRHLGYTAPPDTKAS
jgi:hypothetical protein